MRWFSFLLGFLTIFEPGVARAQRPVDRAVSREEKVILLGRTADLIERYYVDEAGGHRLAGALRDSMGIGAIGVADSALALVRAVNRLFRANGGDRHLRFGYQAEAQAGPVDTLAAPDPPETPEELAARRAEAAADGFGILGVERLDGNIGLLRWGKFHDPDVAGEAVAAAMTLLEPTEALLIDLRDSEGGSPEMVAWLASYFLPEGGEPRLLSIVENRYLGRTIPFWSTTDLTGPRYDRKPVYLLAGPTTFSAAEGFLEVMRRVRGLVTVVGDTTRGGARMSRWMTVHPHFAVSISVARHIGETVDWEGAGVRPDMPAPAEEALRVAHLASLQWLRESAVDTKRREELDAVIGRVAVSPPR